MAPASCARRAGLAVPAGATARASTSPRAASPSAGGREPRRLVIFNNSESLADCSKRTGIAVERLEGAKKKAGGRVLVVNDYVEDLPEDRSAVREATAPESTALTRAGETWATLRDATPPWAGVALPALALALALAAVTRARRPREDRRGPSATPTPVGAESFDVSDLDLTPGRMEWWRDLPFVCVILFSSDQGGSQWFSVDMGEEGRRENRILGFESADDANRLRYVVGATPDFAGKFPRVQVVSPQDLLHASNTLETEVFVVRGGQLAPSAGDSLKVIEDGLSEIYFKEKLGVKYET
ncbi:hypothetical protein HKI87_07g48830 [Chloropicon roscoffensis]|uniref:Uncharacterized protein n=1 Tax=Chloropicon roscoffensis TaxID=1461544 RepID=A0AAX4PCK4_9CHLO